MLVRGQCGADRRALPAAGAEEPARGVPVPHPRPSFRQRVRALELPRGGLAGEVPGRGPAWLGAQPQAGQLIVGQTQSGPQFATSNPAAACPSGSCRSRSASASTACRGTRDSSGGRSPGGARRRARTVLAGFASRNPQPLPFEPIHGPMGKRRVPITRTLAKTTIQLQLGPSTQGICLDVVAPPALKAELRKILQQS